MSGTTNTTIRRRTASNKHNSTTEGTHNINDDGGGGGGGRRTTSSTVLWVTYLNIVLYALSYQLQTPVEPFLVKQLSEQQQEALVGSSDSFNNNIINRTYGNLHSFFQVLQTVGSPLVGVLLDRIGVRYTSAIVFLASALSYAILSQAHDLRMLFWSKLPTVFQAAFLVAQATAATAISKDDATARAAALGRMTTAYTVGATLGPALGGYLADQGDFYIGAKLAVVGSLLSVILSLIYLPNETHKREKEERKSDITAEDDAVAQLKRKKRKEQQGSFLDGIYRSVAIALRSALWPLLLVKVLGGVVASMHSTAMPLVLTQQLQWEPSQLGLYRSGSMVSVAIFAAVAISPLTKWLGPSRLTHAGLLGRALAGWAMAIIVSISVAAAASSTAAATKIVSVAILHAVSSHALATGLTTQTTGAVATSEQGSLLGMEHSLFSLARIGGPKISTALLALGGGLWPVETVCGASDVLLVAAVLAATASSRTSSKEKGP